jgi:cytochrome c peroxidase
VGNLLTDANIRLHDPTEVVSEPDPNGVPSDASRSATKKYRTTPLRGLLRHPPYFHNGIPATLDAIVEFYDARKGSTYHGAEGRLVEYLESR